MKTQSRKRRTRRALKAAGHKTERKATIKQIKSVDRAERTLTSMV